MNLLMEHKGIKEYFKLYAKWENSKISNEDIINFTKEKLTVKRICSWSAWKEERSKIINDSCKKCGETNGQMVLQHVNPKLSIKEAFWDCIHNNPDANSLWKTQFDLSNYNKKEIDYLKKNYVYKENCCPICKRKLVLSGRNPNKTWNCRNLKMANGFRYTILAKDKETGHLKYTTYKTRNRSTFASHPCPWNVGKWNDTEIKKYNPMIEIDYINISAMYKDYEDIDFYCYNKKLTDETFNRYLLRPLSKPYYIENVQDKLWILGIKHWHFKFMEYLSLKHTETYCRKCAYVDDWNMGKIHIH